MLLLVVDVMVVRSKCKMVCSSRVRFRDHVWLLAIFIFHVVSLKDDAGLESRDVCCRKSFGHHEENVVEQQMQDILTCLGVQYSHEIISEFVGIELLEMSFKDLLHLNFSRIESWRIVRCGEQYAMSASASQVNFETSSQDVNPSTNDSDSPSWGRPPIEIIYPVANETISLSVFREVMFRYLSIPPDEDYRLEMSLHFRNLHDSQQIVWHHDVMSPVSKSIANVDDEAPQWHTVSVCFLESCENPVLDINDYVSEVEMQLRISIENQATEWHSSAACPISLKKYTPKSDQSASVHLSTNYVDGAHAQPSMTTPLADASADASAAAAPPPPDPPAAGEPRDWSRYCVARDGPTYADEKWFFREDWWEWSAAGMREASLHLFHATDPAGAGAGAICEWEEEAEEEFGFPVYVMNLRHRRDRRAHTARLLGSLGFRNVSFPPTTYARDLDVPALLRAGAVAPAALADIARDVGGGAVRPYLAIALDYAAAVARGAEAGLPLFGVFEDDLAAGACPAETARRIAAAVGELPPTADLLYLEACFEKCEAVRHSHRRPRLVRAAWPACHGAVLYTARGARRAAALLRPVFAGSDSMLPTLIGSGRLEAYIAVPGLLFQDGYWGSDNNRTSYLPFQGGGPRRRHTIIAPLCYESPTFRISASARVVLTAADIPVAFALPRRSALPDTASRAAAAAPPPSQAAARPAARAAAAAAENTFLPDEPVDGDVECPDCKYVLLEDPTALCDGCLIPPGGVGSLVLPSGGPGGPAPAADGTGGAGALDGFTWLRTEDLARPAAVRVPPWSLCWVVAQCDVHLVMHGPDGWPLEPESHHSVLLLRHPEPT